jgi:thiol:disulfide interchange protein DsbD
MVLRASFLLALLWVFKVPTLGSPQTESPIKWSARVASPHPFYRAGDKLTVVLKAAIEPGWHLYSFPQPAGSPVMPTMILVPNGQTFVQEGKIERQKPDSAMDPNLGVQTEFYENSAAFRIPLRVELKSHPGRRKLTLQVRYQACNDRLCLPPKTETVETLVEIREEPVQK